MGHAAPAGLIGLRGLMGQPSGERRLLAAPGDRASCRKRPL